MYEIITVFAVAVKKNKRLALALFGVMQVNIRSVFLSGFKSPIFSITLIETVVNPFAAIPL